MNNWQAADLVLFHQQTRILLLLRWPWNHLRILSYTGHHRERTLCGNALLQAQQDNGGWAGDYILRIPAPYVMDPNQVISWNNADGGGNSLIEDKDGLFATAIACYALACWRQTETQDPLLND
ncbi:MAG: hypothetical protein WDO71_08165 [Bacteroidota bacterium]